MIYDIFFVLFFLTSVVSVALVYYSLKRVTQYEDLIIQFQQIITYATERMKLIDDSGHYEADDETGFFFEELKQLQLQLDDIFENEVNDNDN
jgi:hypothetical protein